MSKVVRSVSPSLLHAGNAVDVVRGVMCCLQCPDQQDLDAKFQMIITMAWCAQRHLAAYMYVYLSVVIR